MAGLLNPSYSDSEDYDVGQYKIKGGMFVHRKGESEIRNLGIDYEDKI